MAAILVAALRRADEDELQAICEALVDTGEPAALAAVVRRLHRLGPRGLEMLGAAPPGPFGSAVRLVLSRGRCRSTLNAIEVIECRADPALFGDLGRLLTSSLRGVAERAGNAILAVTVAQVGPHGRRRRDREAVERLDETLAAASERRSSRPGRARTSPCCSTTRGTRPSSPFAAWWTGACGATPWSAAT